MDTRRVVKNSSLYDLEHAKAVLLQNTRPSAKYTQGIHKAPAAITRANKGSARRTAVRRSAASETPSSAMGSTGTANSADLQPSPAEERDGSRVRQRSPCVAEHTAYGRQRSSRVDDYSLRGGCSRPQARSTHRRRDKSVRCSCCSRANVSERDGPLMWHGTAHTCCLFV